MAFFPSQERPLRDDCRFQRLCKTAMPERDCVVRILYVLTLECAAKLRELHKLSSHFKKRLCWLQRGSRISFGFIPLSVLCLFLPDVSSMNSYLKQINTLCDSVFTVMGQFEFQLRLLQAQNSTQISLSSSTFLKNILDYFDLLDSSSDTQSLSTAKCTEFLSKYLLFFNRPASIIDSRCENSSMITVHTETWIFLNQP